MAKKAKISGKVTIGFTLNPNGKLTDVKVLNGINDVLDKEAIRVVKLTSGKWNPARFEDENFSKEMAIPIVVIY